MDLHESVYKDLKDDFLTYISVKFIFSFILISCLFLINSAKNDGNYYFKYFSDKNTNELIPYKDISANKMVINDNYYSIEDFCTNYTITERYNKMFLSFYYNEPGRTSVKDINLYVKIDKNKEQEINSFCK